MSLIGTNNAHYLSVEAQICLFIILVILAETIGGIHERRRFGCPSEIRSTVF